ncbi:DUF6596 domain-containing protein [Kitasatospora sp. NPDC004240]
MINAVDAHRTVDAVWKLESARIVATLTRMVRDVGLAEELAQDALVAALEQWPVSGVPANPAAWLTTIAKRRAVDHIRRAQRLERKQEELGHELLRSGDPFEAGRPEYRDGSGEEYGEEPGARPEPESSEPGPGSGPGSGPGFGSGQDDVLRLMFISCHPVLPTEARVALTLRLLGGLTAEEIARAFLTTGTAVTQRIAAAKRTLAQERVPFELPAADELAERLSSVLEVVYLVFNEGYSATSGDDLIRPALCHEALRLGRLLAELAPGEAEVHGLVALMEIQASRSAARTGPDGEPVQLHEQNRGRWDQLLIRRGFAAMLRARRTGGAPGPYVLQAAIAVCHAQARTAEETDWAQIATLYGALERLLPTSVVRLNRAVAVGMAYGPGAGLDLLDALVTDPVLRDYHLLPSVRGDLLARQGRSEEAAREFRRAAALTRNAAERAFLLRRADDLPGGRPAGVTLAQAAEAFLARDGAEAATVRSYGQTLRRLCLDLGGDTPLTGLDAERVGRAFTAAWGTTAARTWNRHRAAVRSFAAWAAGSAGSAWAAGATGSAGGTAGVAGLAAGIGRRTEPRTGGDASGTPPLGDGIDDGWLDALWARTDLPLRERVLWRLLHESGAPVTTVLALNVEDLDLDDRRTRAGAGSRTRSGPGAGRVGWRSATARLLPQLIGGRTRGPLFLSDRRPGPARTPAAADLCPETGRRRLSYERAEYLFKRATRTLDPAGEGYTLRRLRPDGRP